MDDVELVGDTLVRISFRHRGTDDDSGWLVVPAEYVKFEADYPVRCPRCEGVDQPGVTHALGCPEAAA